MIHHILNLQLILVVGMQITELPELISHHKALLYPLGRYKVACYLNTASQVSYLMRSTGGNKNSIAHELKYRERHNVVFLFQSRLHFPVYIVHLVVNRIRILFNLLAKDVGPVLQQSKKLFII